MTDITDRDRRAAREWAEYIADNPIRPGRRAWMNAVARVILATVDAPAPTLAEELRYRADLLDNGDPDGDTPQALRALADRAEQVERDLAEARAEVERLTAERVTEPSPTLNDGSMTPDPADVKPGEAWKAHIWFDGVRQPGTAIKIAGSRNWVVARDDGSRTAYRMNEYVELVSCLVPAPRVITNPDDLDRLAEGSIVRDRAGHAWERYPDEDWYSTEELDDGFSSRRLADYAGPVTVLWEPEVPA